MVIIEIFIILIAWKIISKLVADNISINFRFIRLLQIQMQAQDVLYEADCLLSQAIKHEEQTKLQVKNMIYQQADLIFKNGTIITMNQEQQFVKFVAVKDAKIVEISNEQCILVKWNGQRTKHIDLEGKTMLPGFIDPHIHYTFSHMGNWIDLRPFTNSNSQQIWEKIVEAAKNSKKGEWILGYGYDYVVTQGIKLDLSIKALDELSLESPIFIVEINYHVAHANSAAFQQSGVTKDSPDPPHSRYVRDEDGNLTGRVEQIPAINYIANHSPPISAKQYTQKIHQFFRLASSKGCTYLHDCGIGAYQPKIDYKAIQIVMKQNPCVRLSGFLVSHAWSYWQSLGLKPQKKDPQFRINGIKCWSDGSLQCGSAFLKQPYSNIFCGCGAANYSQQYLNNVVQSAHKDGWQIGIHANGDAAIDMVIEAYEKAIQKNPRQDIRHRIQHCTLCRQDQLAKMKKIGIHPSFLIGHIYYYGELFNDDILGPQRAVSVHPVKSALKHGLRPTLHSDDKCQPIGPLRCIYNAVTRKTLKTGKVMNKDQKLTIMEALKTMTIDAAWQCQADDIVGSIEVGKLADFVILDSNPLETPEDQIINIQVLQTWMNGVLRYQNKG